MRQFIRTCQECRKRVRATEPHGITKTDYNNRVCPSCHSRAFDYGSWQDVEPKTLIRLPNDNKIEEK